MMKKLFGGTTLGTQVTRPGLGGSLSSLVSPGGKISGGGGGGGGQANPQQPSDEDVLNGYVNMLYAAYKPAPLVYTAATPEQLRTEISAWLRPSYERAILERQKRTETYRAELDADAISRGMGTSSYVTDVKSRQMEEEAEDVTTLESQYGAALAETLSERLENERARRLETDQINNENDHDAYMRAYSAALTMFTAYKARGGGSGGGGGGGGASSTGQNVVATTPENCDAFLKLLSSEERAEIYSGSTEQGQRYRAELIASVGLSGYYRFMNKYKG